MRTFYKKKKKKKKRIQTLKEKEDLVYVHQNEPNNAYFQGLF